MAENGHDPREFMTRRKVTIVSHRGGQVVRAEWRGVEVGHRLVADPEREHRRARAGLGRRGLDGSVSRRASKAAVRPPSAGDTG